MLSRILAESLCKHQIYCQNLIAPSPFFPRLWVGTGPWKIPIEAGPQFGHNSCFPAVGRSQNSDILTPIGHFGLPKVRTY